MRVIKLLPQDSEHASRLRTHITLTHIQSEVKSTVYRRAVYNVHTVNSDMGAIQATPKMFVINGDKICNMYTNHLFEMASINMLVTCLLVAEKQEVALMTDEW